MANLSFPFDIIVKIFSVWSLSLIFISFILNILVCFICVRSKDLRSKSTFKLLAFGAINDLFCCISWNLEIFTNRFFNLELYYRNLFYCKVFSVFLQYTALNYSSWNTVSVSLDRAVGLCWSSWNRKYFAGNRPIFYSILMAVIMIAINFNAIFTGGHSYMQNGTEVIVCYEESDGNSVWYNIIAQVMI